MCEPCHGPLATCTAIKAIKGAHVVSVLRLSYGASLRISEQSVRGKPGRQGVHRLRRLITVVRVLEQAVGHPEFWSELQTHAAGGAQAPLADSLCVLPACGLRAPASMQAHNGIMEETWWSERQRLASQCFLTASGFNATNLP